MFCQRCNSDTDLIVQSSKAGGQYVYYICRKCNREKTKAYRDSHKVEPHKAKIERLKGLIEPHSTPPEPVSIPETTSQEPDIIYETDQPNNDLF